MVLARLIRFIPPESNQHLRNAELEHTFDTVSVSEMPQKIGQVDKVDKGFPASFAHRSSAFKAEKNLG